MQGWLGFVQGPGSCELRVSWLLGGWYAEAASWWLLSEYEQLPTRSANSIWLAVIRLAPGDCWLRLGSASAVKTATGRHRSTEQLAVSLPSTVSGALSRWPSARLRP